MSRKRGPAMSREDRLASLEADIDALPRTRRSERVNAVRMDVDFLLAPYSIIRAAAHERRLSVTAYVRRATYAMACHDLGIPLSEALTRDPRVARENGFGVDDPEGTIFGSWEIERLRGGQDGAGR